MAINPDGWVKFLTWTKQTGTGVQTVTGVGGTGKAMILWSTRQTAVGTTDAAHLLNGMADAASNQMCRYIRHPDNQATTTSAQSESYSRLIHQVSATNGTTPTVEVDGEFTGFTSDGFTINWHTNDGVAAVFHCLVLGGNYVSASYVRQAQSQLFGVSTTYTGLTFRPDSFIVIGGAATGSSYDLGANFGSMHGFGFSDAVTNITGWTLGLGGGVAETHKGQHTDRAATIRLANNSGGNELGACSISAISSNGFSMTAVSVNPVALLPYTHHVLCIRGLHIDIGSINTPAAPGTKTIPTSVQPVALLLQTHNSTIAEASDMSLAEGAWSQDGASGSAWIGGTNAANPSVYARSIVSGKVIQSLVQAATGSASTVAIEATVQSVTSLSAVLNFTVVPGTPVPLLYVAFAPTPPVPFANAELTTGLTWMILTTRTGDTYVWSDRPLPDRVTYFYGWKEFRVTKWGKIRRALSQVLTGQYENATFDIELDDTDRLLRQLDKDAKMIGATVTVHMISDAGRRVEGTPTTVFRGTVTEGAPSGTLLYNITVKDPYAEQIVSRIPAPLRVFNLDDHPVCAKDKVACSAENYLTSAPATAGGFSVFVDAGDGIFVTGAQLSFAGHATSYTVSSSDLTDPETRVAFTPALTANVADDEAITVKETFTVPAAVNKRVPVPYGVITDRHLTGGKDDGDGQGPVVYVGDRVLSDGKSWAEFVWSATACYSPGGSPFLMIYFFNNPAEDGPSTFYYGAQTIVIGTLATEAGAGGRIAIPGYANWATLGYTDTFIDINGRRYTRLFLRGIFRDWALGILRAPDNLGGVPFAVNAYGCDSIGDSTGTLIHRGFQQYLHVLQNWIPPRGDCYQSGPWLTTPSYPDGTLMIDEASFAAADAQSAVYVPGGFQGDFILAVNNDQVSARDLVARFNLSFSCQSGFNNKIQFMVDLVNVNIGTVTLAAKLGWERDIFAGTFKIDATTRELFTVIQHQHTLDYFNREPSGWRSATSGVIEVENTTSEATYNISKKMYTFSLYMIRTVNRSTDSTDYANGTLTADAVLALIMARLSAIQHLPTLGTGPAGFSYELGNIVPITHYEGLSVTGWTDHNIRIERIEIDPSQYVISLEGYDIDPILGAI